MIRKYDLNEWVGDKHRIGRILDVYINKNDQKDEIVAVYVNPRGFITETVLEPNEFIGALGQVKYFC